MIACFNRVGKHPERFEMDFIRRVLSNLEDKGVISRIPVGDSYTPPTFDKQGRMIGKCNTCGQETVSVCPSCSFFRCVRCTCDVCAENAREIER